MLSIGSSPGNRSGVSYTSSAKVADRSPTPCPGVQLIIVRFTNYFGENKWLLSVASRAVDQTVVYG